MNATPAALSLLPFLTDLRRRLHACPEPSDSERDTQKILMDALTKFCPDEMTPMVGSGLRVVYHGVGPAFLFRADMDALPIREETGCAYASQNPGFMHACGHDGHMAMLAGLAALLHQRRQRGVPSPTAVLLFQPAEETVGGAQRLIAAGALENPRADAVFGLHMMPDVPLGRVGIRGGAIMAETIEFDVELTGERAHGAMPHRGKDALLAAAQLTQQLQTVLTRMLDPFEMALLGIGKLTAGEARNVVASTARLECMFRTFSPAIFETFWQRAEECLRGIEISYGVRGEMTTHTHYPAVINDDRLAKAVAQLLPEAAQDIRPMMIAEDFSFYQRERPGLFAFLGCGDDAHAAPLHSSRFDFDESALAIGLSCYEAILDRSEIIRGAIA